MFVGPWDPVWFPVAVEMKFEAGASCATKVPRSLAQGQKKCGSRNALRGMVIYNVNE